MATKLWSHQLDENVEIISDWRQTTLRPLLHEENVSYVTSHHFIAATCGRE